MPDEILVRLSDALEIASLEEKADSNFDFSNDKTFYTFRVYLTEEITF